MRLAFRCTTIKVSLRPSVGSASSRLSTLVPDWKSGAEFKLAEATLGALVPQVADLAAANAALKAENQALRDEVARLKGY